MLVDTGWSGHNHRDAERIAAAARHAGVRKIDYLVITHYHRRSCGRRLPTRREVADPELRRPRPADGNRQTGRNPVQRIQRHPRQGRAPGGEAGRYHPMKGLDVKVLSANGNVIAAPLPGAGEPNPACAGYARPAADPDGKRPLHRPADHLRRFPHASTWATSPRTASTTWCARTTRSAWWTCSWFRTTAPISPIRRPLCVRLRRAWP